jgi:hypothetical protein
MVKVTMLIAVCALFGAASALAQGVQVFKGQIAQCACGGSDAHAATGDKGGAATPCAFACAKPGAHYFLFDPRNKAALQLDNQDFAKAFNALVVYVIGILDKPNNTIQVNNIVPDVSPRVKQAKTAAIVCDACVRGMAKAKLAAFEELTVWKRYALIADPKKADLIFLFSANPYLGDYVTRDGPDTRLVRVETNYMNVVDPHTGENLWGDHQKVGSWFIASSTKDMISELRELVEADESPVQRKLFAERNRIPKVAINTGK